MAQQEREDEETVGLTDMVLDAEPDPPPLHDDAKVGVRDPARDGADPGEDLPLAGQ